MKVLQKMIWCLRVMIYHRVMLQELVELRSLEHLQQSSKFTSIQSQILAPKSYFLRFG